MVKKSQNRLIQSSILFTILSALYPLYLQTLHADGVNWWSRLLAYILPVITIAYAWQIKHPILRIGLIVYNIVVLAIVAYLPLLRLF